ncbi:PfkB family carbohydrate kinase [Streptomyces sp. NPDC002838]|uniref:PfkB family carbohydrate kinase n=1 Tax=Streptomyces sp. NPDC002838 TaxID=3154436 RepID=UPI00332C999F
MTPTGPCNAPDVVDVVALGESMVTFLPSRPGRLADVPSFERGIGGAESNVACGLAAAGHSVRWVSRVGADGFGDHLVEAIGSYGVDVASVRRDPARPTGVYFRTAGDRATDAHEVAYYRAGSAASAMSVENVDLRAVRAGRVLHLSGITAALSGECLDLLRELTAPGECRPLISFDVNHRAGLWQNADGPRVLLELARQADIVFVGEDEAEEAWGVTGGAEAIRGVLPEPSVLVVKEGARGATVFERERERAGLGLGSGERAGRGERAGWGERAGSGSGERAGRGERAGSGSGERAGRGERAGSGSGSGSGERVGRGERAGWGERAGSGSGERVGSGERAGRGEDAGRRGGHGTGAAVGASDAQPPGHPAPARGAQPRRWPAGSRAAGAAPDPKRDGTPSAPGRATHPAAATPGTTQPTDPTPTLLYTDTVTSVPALNVTVVATIGAGDAFAAGFLSATLRGLPVRDRIRHGHLMAAATLTTPGDLATPPTRTHADRLAALDDAEWGRLRLGPGWTQTAGRADEEVRTP